MRVGWTADLAPFRPVLQLLEPKAGKSGGRADGGAEGKGSGARREAQGGAGNGEDDGGVGAEPPAEWKLRLVLQDKQDEPRLVPVRLAGTGEAFGTWPSGWTAHVRERAGGWLEQLRASLPAGLVADGDDALRRPLDDRAAWRFLTADGPKLVAAGWQVLLPAWWEAARRKKPKLRAKIEQEQPQGGGRSLFGLDAILSFDWRIAIGDAELSEAEFKRLVARGERLVRFRDRWIALDPELLAQIQRAMDGMDKSQGLSFQDVLQLHLLGLAEAADANGQGAGDGAESAEDAERQAVEAAARVQIEVELNEHLAHLVSQLQQPSELPKPATPTGLHAELRSYQREGFAWLAFLRRFGLGAVLADDMGLGKTVQLISYLLDMKENAPDGKPQPALIICPTSVLGNWQKELQRFAPSLSVMLHYGSGRLSGSEAFADAASSADVVLTSYATASLDQEMLQTFQWASICLDEAQNIKNAQTKQSAAVRSFRARHRVALTGTPVENRLAELWSIYDFIAPGYLGSQRAFQQRFAAAIEQEGDAKKTAELRRLINPFMLRHKKKDPSIQLDLPDKNEMKTYIHLSAEQAASYDRIVRELLEKLNKLEGIERKGAVLGALTRLKQACDHPSLLEGEAADTAAATAGRSSGGELAEAELAAAVGRSSKLERLLDMVKELRDEGEKCLIFTQFIGMGRMIQAVLEQELGEPVLYLHGGTPKLQRDRMIERFQARDLPPDEQPNVFVLSLKAGGVGLNLTAANHVFHFDRWWNPAVENQATDRAYRIGQTKDVQVHKFISLGTLEERIDEMLESKQALSDNVVSSSEGWITELSNDELRDLFTLRRNWSA
ncbi:DEAD/DEAH box helicase [Cohnella lubricantis]|uniref:DEAD/DEAH box helicase n=2 Tax=Cohnella lubricantis TaxID=2163172 RepID=A0A841TB98_9BACL|nr:DEAD/DEAH box helicase [Cohnella lubricantis]